LISSWFHENEKNIFVVTIPWEIFSCSTQKAISPATANRRQQAVNGFCKENTEAAKLFDRKN
jgi:hypothetical protein